MKSEKTEATEDKKQKSKKHGKGMLLALGAACVIGMTGSIFVYNTLHQKEDTASAARPDFPHENAPYVTATGTTVVGVQEEEFEIDFLEDTNLYVEEVYLVSGDEVSAGTPYIKFSEESIADARKELEDASLNASVSYRTGVMSTEESKIKAQYTYRKTILAGEQAQAVYEDKIAQLAQTVEEKKEAYTQAKEALEQLQNDLSGGYEEEFAVAAKKKAYEENQKLYHDILEKYDMTEDDLTENDADTQASPNGMMKQDSDIKWQKNAITLVKEEYEESEEEYEQAQKSLEAALRNYEYKLKKAQNELDEALADYQEAQLAYEKESLTAKTELETALARANTAKLDYDTEISALQEELSKQKDAQEDAAENLALFEETVGDGYLYTGGEGTIIRVMAREGEYLEGGNVILLYQDLSKLTVSVSVSQEDISKLTVGEEAYVSISGHGDYDGTIASINPVASSDSKTAVSYTVEVAIQGDISDLTPNLTANVTFGTTQEEMNARKQDTPPDVNGGEERPQDSGENNRMGEKNNEQEADK